MTSENSLFVNDAVELAELRPRRKVSKRYTFLRSQESPIRKKEGSNLSNDRINRKQQASARYFAPWSSRKLHSPSNLDQTVRYGNLQQIRNCLQSLSNLKSDEINRINDRDGLAPLHVAARFGDPLVVELLLQHGADINLAGDEEKQAIHFAAKFNKKIQRNSALQTIKETDVSSISRRGKSKKNSLQVLIEYGADVNARDKFQSTPLHYACDKGHLEAVEILLSSKNIEVNIYNDQKSTPLHEASGHGHVEIVKKILSLPGDGIASLIEAVDENEATALLLACREGYTEVAMVLMKAANRSLPGGAIKNLLHRDLDGSTALHASIESGHFETVELLLEAWYKETKQTVFQSFGHTERQEEYVDLRRGDGYTPLHLAADVGSLEMLKLLIERGAFLNPLNNNNMTPVLMAAQRNNISCLQYLLEKKCDTEIVDNWYLSPLLIACKFGNIEAVNLLVQCGADLHATDYFSRNCFFFAVEEGQIELVKYLLTCSNHSALVEECDRFGNTVLHECASRGYLSTMKLLVEFGMRLDARNDTEQTPLHFAAMNNQHQIIREIVALDRSTLNDQDDHSRGPLHLAAIEGHEDTVMELINLGAATGDLDVNHWTPFHTCVAEGWLNCAKALLRADHTLLNCKTRRKETPLHIACSKGKSDMVKLLLEWGADVSARLPDGRNPLNVAIGRLEEKCAIALIQHDNWMDSMKNVSFCNGSDIPSTPLRQLIQHMPDVAELVLTKCTKFNSDNAANPCFKVNFNYELLEDMYEIDKWKKECEERENFMKKKQSLRKQSNVTTTALQPPGSYRDSIDGQNVMFLGSVGRPEKIVSANDGCIQKGEKPYSKSSSILAQNHPLTIMVREQREKLLSHPIVRSIINYKERRYGNYLYWFNVLSFILYLILLMVFTGTTPPRYAIDEPLTRKLAEAGQRCVRVIPPATPIWGNVCQDRTPYRNATSVIILIFSSLQLLKEIAQLIHLRLNYFRDFGNYLELALYSLSILIFVDLDPLARSTGIKTRWQWELCAFAVLFAFINFSLYFRRSRLGIYIYMIASVGRSFMSIAPVMITFLAGFAFSFYILLQNQVAFSHPVTSFVKTFVMVIGEFEYEDIFLNNANNTSYESRVYYSGSTTVIFIVFVIVMSLMLANLLIGIAVDDIASVYYKASLKQLSVEVEVFLEEEYLFPECIRRRFVVRRREYKPNQHANRNFFYRWFAEERNMSAEHILDRVGYLKKTEMEKFTDELDSLKSAMNQFTSTLNDMNGHKNEMKEKMAIMSDQVTELCNNSKSLRNQDGGSDHHQELTKTCSGFKE